MRAKIILLAIISVFIIPVRTTGQVIVYNTYDQFKSKTGEKYDDTYKFFMLAQSFGVYTVIFHSPKQKKLSIKTTQVWGFEYKGHLFRIEKDKNTPVALISQGDVCYYENGEAYLKMYTTGEKSTEFMMGEYSYMSKDLEDNIFNLRSYFTHDIDVSELKWMKKEHPETAEVVNCIIDHSTFATMKGQSGYMSTRDCVEKYNHVIK